jgi:ppGpp synthetase/RelA/SpoT-type nucleotidyltranferase
LLGLRIICYIYSDIKKISDLIRDNFIIHEAEDKSEKLGIDKFGYQSVHFIVSLSKHRTNLPEYSRFKGIEFEIQVRTILQHTWAQIEHDRNYKFRGKLPESLQKRFQSSGDT